MDNRFYLQALGVTGLFVGLLLIFWVASGGPASEAGVRNANSTRTAIASTEVFLLRDCFLKTFQDTDNTVYTEFHGKTLKKAALFRVVREIRVQKGKRQRLKKHSLRPFPTNTSPPFIIPTFVEETGVPDSASTRQPAPSPTNTPILPVIPLFTPLPTQTAIVQVPGIPRTGVQDPAEFARWYFGRVWKERDYQNLWDNYLIASFKAHVGSGLFEDYVEWWNSVERVEVNSVDVMENNGTVAWVHVNITIRMKNGHVLPNQIFDYDLLYDADRGTWMFDYGA